MECFETVKSSELAYNGKFLHLRKDIVELPNGKTTSREVLEHCGAVCILAFSENGKILLVKQYRHPFKEVLTELPAGKIDEGETPEECGMRELEEETGYTCEKLSPMGKLYPSCGYTDEVIHLFSATKLKKTNQNLDEDEFLNVIEMDFDEVLKMVLNNDIPDAKTQIAILKAKQLSLNEI